MRATRSSRWRARKATQGTEFSPRPIHDDTENERATAMLEKIGALENPTPEQIAVAEILTTLIEVYEKKYSL